jgi:hypothetical protein
MAQIEFPSGGLAQQLATVKADITRYWGGNIASEISYPIDCKMLRRLASQSPTGHVALKIENISTPTSVIAYWIPYNNSTPPTDSAFYRVIDTAWITILCNDIDAAFSNKLIDARLAQPTIGDYYVFFHKIKCSRKGPGGGGTVEGAGVTVR